VHLEPFSTSACPPRHEIGGFETQSVYLFVPDADRVYARAIAAGTTIVMDIKDEDYGGRGFTCRDFTGWRSQLILFTNPGEPDGVYRWRSFRPSSLISFTNPDKPEGVSLGHATPVPATPSRGQIDSRPPR